MKKVFLGMLVIALGFGTMSLTTNASVNNQEVKVTKFVEGATYTCPWNKCCESPLTAVERDLVARGLPPSGYTVLSTTNTTATYKIN